MTITTIGIDLAKVRMRDRQSVKVDPPMPARRRSHVSGIEIYAEHQGHVGQHRGHCND